MRVIFSLIVSCLIAYVSWSIYHFFESWNFFIAFMGGAVAMSVNIAMDRYFRQTHKDVKY